MRWDYGHYAQKGGKRGVGRKHGGSTANDEGRQQREREQGKAYRKRCGAFWRNLRSDEISQKDNITEKGKTS